MSVAENDILRIVAGLLWTDGNINQNVYNAKVSGGTPPYSDSDIADDASDWLDDMYANIVATCSDEIDGNNVTVYKYDPGDDDWDEVFSQPWTWDPTGGLDQLPRGVAGLIRCWTTDPDVQGKKYLAGLTEGAVTDGLVNIANLALFVDMATDWVTPFVGAASGATFTPGIWSVVETLFFAAVDHYAASAIPAYQRRRKRTVGI